MDQAEASDRPRVLMAAAVTAAISGLVIVGATTLADGEPGTAGRMVLAASAAAAAGMSFLRREHLAWWAGAAAATGAAAVFALLGGTPMAHQATLSTTESSIELLWLMGALALLVSAFRVGHRLDGSRLRVSRLDGALAATSAATVLVLVALPTVGESGVSGARDVLFGAHAAIAVVTVAVVVRLLLVSVTDRIFAIGVMAFALCGLARSWADAVGEVDAANWSTIGVAGAVGLLAVAVPFHRPEQASPSHRVDVANERVPVVGLFGLAPPVVALLQSGLGFDLDGHVLAFGMAGVLFLIAARLHVVIQEVQDAARRDSLVRQTSARIAAARDVSAVSAAAMDAVTTLLADELRFAGWVKQDRKAGYEVEHFTSNLGHLDPHRSGLYTLLDSRSTASGLDVVKARVGGAAVVTVIDRPWQGFAVSCAHELSADALELLPAIGTQAAMAIDGIGRQAELLGRRSEARFEELVRHTNDAIVIVDRSGTIQYQTPSVVRLLGYLPVDLDGTPVRDLVPGAQLESFDRFLHRQSSGVAERGDVVGLTLKKADDSVVEVEMVGSNLMGNPDVRGLVLTIRDVTRHRELESQLRHQAFHDGLTGLANRVLFAERLHHALSVNRRNTGPTPAVAFIDLDDFKEVNDTLGHAAGDDLLKTIAARIADCVRAGDTAARFGGDEFAVLFEQAAEPEDIIEACERLLEAMQAPVTIGDEVVRVRASIGVATRQDGLGEAGEILRCADLAMYAAKEAGKGCVERFQPEMHEAMVAQLTNHTELEQAIAGDDLYVEYQPVVNMGTNNVEAFEALVRWNHATRGPVAPSEFVSLAEQIGCIYELGEKVLRTAVDQLALWNQRSARPVSVHVNVSVRQLENPGFVPLVRDMIDEAGVDPSLLVLEITESVFLADAEAMLGRLEALDDTGIRLALDDFGTGFSSLSYLQRVPLALLKIDRSFVSSLGDVDPDETLVQTIIDLAKRLGVTAIAEGVERESERDALSAMGCDLGQGYLYGRAVSPAEATRLLDGRVLRPVRDIA